MEDELLVRRLLLRELVEKAYGQEIADPEEGYGRITICLVDGAGHVLVAQIFDESLDLQVTFNSALNPDGNRLYRGEFPNDVDIADEYGHPPASTHAIRAERVPNEATTGPAPFGTPVAGLLIGRLGAQILRYDWEGRALWPDEDWSS